MALPGNKNFSDYDNYITDQNPTTSAQAQDYFRNQAELLKAVIDCDFWQPETVYQPGDVVKSDSMPNGTEAVMVATKASVTSNVEPQWGVVGGANISDGACFWRLRWRYWSKVVIPVENGGTGANTAEKARENLGIKGILLDFCYPVGTLYWSKNSTEPSLLFGGTWTRVKDKFILAAGDSYAQGKTGGAATVTLNAAQMPSHSHSASSTGAGEHKHYTGVIAGSGQNTAQAYCREGYDTGKYGGYGASQTHADNTTAKGYTSTTGSHSHAIAINNTGGGEAHENMPPYVAYYCWERTA